MVPPPSVGVPAVLKATVDAVTDHPSSVPVEQRPPEGGWPTSLGRRVMAYTILVMLSFLPYWSLALGAIVVAVVPVRLWLPVTLVAAIFYLPSYFKGDERNPERPRRWSWLQNRSVWKDAMAYFPLSFVRTAPLDPSQGPYMLCFHPHNAWIPVASAVAMGADGAGLLPHAFPGLTLTGFTHRLSFSMPLLRDLVLWIGMQDISKPSLRKTLTSGRSAFLFPGGHRELLESNTQSLRILLRNRRGFARMALETGARLVPVVVVGEEQTFKAVEFLRSFRTFIYEKFHADLTVFRGRWGLPLPFRHPVRYLIGAPFESLHYAAPTDEQVEDLHTRYIDALVALYAAHKTDKDPELVIC